MNVIADWQEAVEPKPGRGSNGGSAPPPPLSAWACGTVPPRSPLPTSPHTNSYPSLPEARVIREQSRSQALPRKSGEGLGSWT